MKNSIILIFGLFISIFSLSLGHAPLAHADWSCAWNWGKSCSDPGQISYCKGDSCTIEQGQKIVDTVLPDEFTDKGITLFVTDTILYFLGFVTLIGVIYVIYAGFQIMTGAGDEEKIKKSRQTIIYVIIGIIVMWLAYAIVGIIIDSIK